MPRSDDGRPISDGAGGEGLAGLRILVVEDEAVLALALQDMLEELGCELAGIAARLEPARELVRRTAFDVALLDVNLGGERVDPLAVEVAALGRPMVFATGHDPGPALLALSSLVLSKPYDQAGLRQMLLRARQSDPPAVRPAAEGERPDERSAFGSAGPSGGLPEGDGPTGRAPEREAWLALALEAGGMGCWEWRIASGEVTWSTELEAIHGLAPGSFGGRFEDFQSDIHPDDRERVLASIARTLEGGGDHRIEYRILRPDGCLRWVEGRGRLLCDGAGRPERMVGICVDVTERKRDEERQRLLLDELNHRVRNTLAIVQSITQQTLRDAGEPAAFVESFLARLSALDAAHTLVTEDLWQGAALADILAAVLAPYADERAEAVCLEGPRVLIGANAAVTLCLIFHELAANAAKHGALCRPGGRLEVNWAAAPPAGSQRRSDGDAEAARLELVWRESGRRRSVPPERRGFGSRLLARGAAQLGGDSTTRYGDGGLEVQLRFPLSQVAGGPFTSR